MKKSIFKNTLLKMILSVFNILVPLVVGPYIARLFDPDLYARYNDALTIVSIVIPIAGFGIYNYGIRMISRVREDARKTSRLFTILFSLGVLTNLAGFALFVFYFTSLRQNADAAIYSALSIQILANIFLTEWMNEAYENYGFIMAKTIFVRLGYVAAVFLFVRNPDDVAVYALLLSLSNLINNFISFLYLRKKVRFSFSFRLSEIPPIVKSLFFLVLISNSGLLFTQLDRLFLSQFGGPIINVSYYVLSQTILCTLLNLVNPIVLVSVPRLSKLLSEGKQADYLRLQAKSARSFLLITIPMNTGVALLGSYIMQLYSGRRYADAGIVLTAFALRNMIGVLDIILANQVLYLYGQERLLMRLMLTGGMVNLAFNTALVSRDAVTPANLVATTAAAEAVVVFLEHLTAKSLNPRLQIFTFHNWKYLGLSLFFIPIYYLVDHMGVRFALEGIFTVLFCVLFYFGVLYLTRDSIVREYTQAAVKRLRAVCKKA